MDAPQVPPSTEIRFRVRRRTRWADDDAQKVLNNAVYMTLLEEGRYAYFHDLGLLQEDLFPFLLLQTNIRFVGKGRGSSEVDIELVTKHLGQSSFTQAYRIRAAQTGDVWCEAEALLVFYDPETGASVPMQDRVREAIVAFESAH